MKHPPLLVAMDLEGVLVPEIWIAVADAVNIPELKRTTRDEPDYDRLMQDRIKILRQNHITMADLRQVIEGLYPLDGAFAFLEELRTNFQLIILSDTFYEFATPLMRQLNWPSLFCNTLLIDEHDMIAGYRLRQDDGKRQAVINLRRMNFQIVAVGDSYNDTTMLQEGDRGILFHAGDKVKRDFPQFTTCDTFSDLWDSIRHFDETR